MKVDVILDSHLTPAELTELGLLAEQHGIGAVWNASYLDGRDPFTNLADFAKASRHIQLGPIALNPYELHPFRIAMQLLTLNEICNGRAQTVIGGGGEVVMALGISPERRVHAVRECIEIVKGACQDRPFSYQGELYSIEDYSPQWVTAKPPVIYAAANRPQMLRMAAQVADGIMLADLSPHLAREAIDQARQHLAEFGREPADFRVSNFLAWYVYEDAEEARREARRWIGYRALFRDYMTLEFMAEDDFGLLNAHMPQIYAMASKGTDSVPGLPNELLDLCVDNLTLTGDPADLDRIIDHLLALKDVGVTEVALELRTHAAQSIRLIGERVVPALR